MIKLSSLKLKDRNPRLITEEALLKLADSIKRDPEFMTLRPIVIDENNVIIGGNQRYKAIQSLGMTEVLDSWVLKADSLTKEQAKRFVLIDNAPDGMAGTWDLSILKEDWDILELTDLGFFENQFDEFLPMSFDDINVEQEQDKDKPYVEKYNILVMCESENHQQMVFEELQDKYNCKIVNV